MAEPTLIAYLEQLRKRGQTHVAVDETAKKILRGFYLKATGKAGKAEKTSPPPANNSRNAAPPRAKKTNAPAPGRLVIKGNDKAARLDSLRAQIATWPALQELQSLRSQLVFSTGNPDARLMLIGEAPGYHEEKQGEPFVGPAGQKLNQILKAMGLAREEVYLSNLVKFRPAMPNQTTGNRPPTAEEMAACAPFIRTEIELVRPACLIALGKTAAQGLLQSGESVSALRGRWHDYQGLPLRVSYHPSYLLHNEEGLGEKRKVWEDMLAVMERLELPISEKQRGYFLPKK